MSQILIISGATASGKSGLAIELAKTKDIAIINADSLQIYQGLPILSAQPNQDEQKQAPHFLYSSLAPHEKSSVASWLNLLKPIIEDCWQKNVLPVVVGGTGMYISALVNGISKIPEISEENKKLVQDFYQENGALGLKQKLISLGEKEILDPQRLTRAYEVYLQTGDLISTWHDKPKSKILPDAKFEHLNLEIDRDELYEKCNQRFALMLENGAIEEVQNLRKVIADANFPVTKTLGYQEICDYLDGKISKNEMITIATQKTRNYAKRQLTWFRNQFNDTKKSLDEIC